MTFVSLTLMVSPPGAFTNPASVLVGDIDDAGLQEILAIDDGFLRAFEYGTRVDAQGPWWRGAVGLQSVVPAWTTDCCPIVDLDWEPASDDGSNPITYEVHRSLTAGFTPSPSTRIGTTGFTDFRDRGLTTGVQYNYIVRARDLAGRLELNTVERDIVLPPAAPPATAPSASVSDADPCVPTGVTVTFVHDGDPPGVTYRLLVDGVGVADNILSPWQFVPADSSSHQIAVAAVHPNCALQSVSAAVPGRDGALSLEPPTDVVLTDADPCLAGPTRVSFVHAGFGALIGTYELQREDGMTWTVTDDAFIDVGDTRWHRYIVAAIGDGCAAARSAPVTHRDRSACEPGTTTLLLQEGAAGTVAMAWTPAESAASCDAYVGTIAALRSGTCDHVPMTTGVTFPDAPDQTSGWDVANGPTVAARAEGLPPGSCLLMVAASAAGVAGSSGCRSDLVDRRDPSVEPRPPSSFCH